MKLLRGSKNHKEVYIVARYREIFTRSPNAYERGVQHGEQVKAEILAVIEGYRDLFSRAGGYTWNELKAIAEKYIAYLSGKMDDLLDEARGIAEGAKVDFAEVMILNTRYELLKFPKENSECTGFALTPQATEAKETIAGQNWDTRAFVGKHIYVLHIDEMNGTKIVGLTEPGQLIRSGMNSHGISTNSMNLLSIYDTRDIGMPTNFARRRILQKKCFAEAEEFLKDCEFTVSCNYLIGSKEGIVADFEACPKELFKVLPLDGVLGHGNDFVIDPSVDRDCPVYSKHPRHFRGQRLHRLLLEERGKITVEYIQSCLSDHYNHPYSVCFHGDPNDKRTADIHTIASVLYCLDRGYALICKGNPCEGKYEQYDL